MAGHPKVKQILEEVWEIHQQKNSDYSNADHHDKPDIFSNFRLCEDFGIDVLDGILVRMSDKWSRAINIHAKGGDHSVPNESLRDAFIDLIGYAAIYIAEYEDQQEVDSIDIDIMDDDYHLGYEAGYAEAIEEGFIYE